MIITFAQYSILMASQRCVTYSQLEQKIHFDRLMVNYYMMGLLNVGLISANYKESSETTFYQLTDKGEQCVRDYEQANPELVIKFM